MRYENGIFKGAEILAHKVTSINIFRKVDVGVYYVEHEGHRTHGYHIGVSRDGALKGYESSISLETGFFSNPDAAIGELMEFTSLFDLFMIKETCNEFIKVAESVDMMADTMLRFSSRLKGIHHNVEEEDTMCDMHIDLGKYLSVESSSYYFKSFEKEASIFSSDTHMFLSTVRDVIPNAYLLEAWAFNEVRHRLQSFTFGSTGAK